MSHTDDKMSTDTDPQSVLFKQAWAAQNQSRTYKTGCARAKAIAAATANEQALTILTSSWTAAAIGNRLIRIKDAYQGDPPGNVLFDTTIHRIMTGEPWVFAKTDGDKDYACPDSSIPRNNTQSIANFAEGTPNKKDRITCYDTPSGAWAILRQPLGCNDLDVAIRHDSTADSSPFFSFRLTTTSRVVVAFVPPAGAVATRHFETMAYYGDDEIQLPAQFDFDGDGREEAIWRASFYNEGTTDLWIDVLTFKNGRIQQYPLPFNRALLYNTEDVNRDGRPDLLLHQGTASEQCGSGFSSELNNVKLLAESLPDGTFSLTTDAAESYLKNQCPSVPTTFSSVTDVACGVLWGIPRNTLLQKIRTQNTTWKCKYETDPNRAEIPKTANPYYDALIDAAHFAYPVQFNSREKLASM